MNWANVAPGGTSRLGTALYMALKAAALIRTVARDADVETEVTGEIEYQYKRRRTTDEAQRVVCRVPQKNSYIGMVTRTNSEEEFAVYEKRYIVSRALSRK